MLIFKKVKSYEVPCSNAKITWAGCYLTVNSEEQFKILDVPDATTLVIRKLWWYEKLWGKLLSFRRWVKRRVIALLPVLLCACDLYSNGDCSKSKLSYPQTDFDISNTQPSPHLGFGWANQTEQNIDVVAVEERLLTMQEEIQAICWSIAGKLDPAWDCFWAKLDCDKQFDWSCLSIKVVNPVFSRCSTMGDGITEVPVELLDVPAPESGCAAKGLEATSECPCRYRMIQQGTTVVTTPTVYLYDLIERMTSCRNYWNSPFKEVAYRDMRRAKQLPKSLWNR